MNKEIKELEKYALNNNIPIMQKEALNYIKKLIKTYNIESILEIGTAIGYSSISFALVSENVKITSIEKDQTRFIQAVKNVKKFNLTDRIELVFNNALEIALPKKYDLIIIDAAKTKNTDFFKKFQANLNKGGIIITDNIEFHGLVGKSKTIPGKNLRNLVKKIENYIDYLKYNKDFKTVFLSIGDGLSISKKRDS